ncbi:hypothetical protein [Pseudosulfitobacter sp. DSM 107133]|uniref:hypothetical protein n=2 Tax=Pseudosulfitobacter sp. DSM 107133 TaxID=2883100 RepID=UPI000DF18E3D|nr:hypothetical protein [Pseudosulfitobacter sp. DSM 107133]
MLKPIHRVECSPALAACQRLMQRFALWLCDPDTADAQINQQGLQPPVLASEIEVDWLWSFLQRVDARQTLLHRAQIVAALPPPQKAVLVTWIQAVSTLSAQFRPEPIQWPVECPIPSHTDWKAFKELMEAFYKVGFRNGLPFLPDGTPTTVGGVTYARYVSEFREAHRQSTNLEAREVCVLCGGPLGQTPEVDHWIAKSAFPLLSICAENLLPICGDCNSLANKGQKPVHSDGSFTDWFHPYLNPGNEAMQITYELHPRSSVRCDAATLVDQRKVANIDGLLNLSLRWTREFKAEYSKQKDVLLNRARRRFEAAKPGYSQNEILLFVEEWEADLLPSEPHYEVRKVLAAALKEQARLAAWQIELSLVR